MKRILTGLLLCCITCQLSAQTMPMGQYNINFTVTTWDPNDNNDHRCTNDFHIYLNLASGWTSVMYQSGLSTPVKTYTGSWTVPANQVPTQMYTTGSRQYHNLFSCKGSKNSKGATVAPPSSPCVTQTYQNIIPNWGSTIVAEMVPVNVSIAASDTALPDQDPVTLVATQGFAGKIYNWQYMNASSGGWKNFPMPLQGTSSVTLTGTQLMGSDFLTAGTNTQIRILYDCGVSNILTLANMYSAPHILSASAFRTLCAGDQNGYLTVQFSRPLMANESLSLSLHNTAYPKDIIAFDPASQPNVNLDGSNSFTWPKELPPGTYQLGMIGVYPDNQLPRHTTYTNGPPETTTLTITSPPAVSYSVIKNNDVYCYGGSDGAITINATGGVGNFTYGYSTDQTNYVWPTGQGIPFPSSAVLKGLSPATYSIRVADGNGCFQKNASMAEVITPMPISQPAAPMALDFSNIDNPLAYGSTDGQVTAVLKGGTPLSGGVYAITWLDPLGDDVTTVTNTTLPTGYQTVLNDGGNGAYMLQATDANYALAAAGQQQGCMLSQTFTLVQPPPLVLNVEQSKRVTCHGYATAQLIAHGSGGIELPVARYHYQWTVQNGGAMSAVGQDDSVLSQLPTGFYQVTITDKNGITKTSSLFLVSEPDVLAVTIATTPLVCNGDSTGIAVPTVTGGTLPYSFNWSTGDTSAVISHLTEGGYFLFVSDSNACQTQLAANITAPDGLAIDTVVIQPSCNQRCDGSIRLNVTGGAGGYTYAWNTGMPASSLAALCAGDYDVRISDANGCNALRKFTLVDPPSLAVKAGQNTTLCNGQTYAADATVSDPAAAYTWAGSNGFSAATPQVSLTDPGTYWVTVTDSRGCSGRDTFTIGRTDKDIAADFVVSTQVFQGQPVTIVNISQPDPDSISWIFPVTTALTVLSQDQVSATLQFNDTGSYAIGLKSWSAPCWKVITQQLVVLKPQSFDNPGTVSDPLVQSFTVAPNPSTGSFTVVVTLSNAANIRIRMVSMLTDAIMDDRQLSGASQYTLPYNMGNIAKGGYFLLLETPEGSSVYKLVIL